MKGRDRRDCGHRRGPLEGGVQGRARRAAGGLAGGDRGCRDGRVLRVQDRRRGGDPDAVAVMDPFHVVRLAGEALDTCSRRVQNDILGRRGRKGDPPYKARRTLHTGASLLTDRQVARSSIGRGRRTGQRKRSTADLNTSAAPHSASGPCPTTSPAVSSKPEASDPNYTLNCDEPVFAGPAEAPLPVASAHRSVSFAL